MQKYVAFLRAINVGGTRTIKMDDLKKMFESFGFGQVQTYINSGNVIFEANDSPNLEAKIESQLEKALGYKVEIFLRTMEEVSAIASKPPFKPQGKDEVLHVVFLRKSQGMDKKSEQHLLSLKSEADEFIVKGSEVYNLRHDRDKSIFGNQFIEKTLKMESTTRNWNTVCKIMEKFK
jgi:uncharacterized protein (DUF1697 family)